MMLHFVIARTEACPYQRIVMSLPHSSVPQEGHVATVLRSPQRLMRETLAGVITALALIPEVISFSVVAAWIESEPYRLRGALFRPFPDRRASGHGDGGGRFRRAGDWPDGPSTRRTVHSAAVVMAGVIQILFGALGMARLMRFIPQSVMTGFVNALGILIFFAQVPHFWSRSPLIVGLFVLTLLIVLWVPRYIKSVPSR